MSEEKLKTEGPPGYDDAIKESPPTYEKIFGVGEMKNEMKDAASGNKGMFALKFIQILCGSAFCMLCTLILTAVPITCIVIGSLYLGECGLEDKIPIFLIVFGCFSIVQTVIDVLKRAFSKKKSRDEERSSSESAGNRGGSCLECLISTFLFVWIILGSVWVFGNYGDFNGNRDMCPDANEGYAYVNCCQPVLYLFSFIMLVVIYVLSGLLCLFMCCCFSCIAIFAGASSD